MTARGNGLRASAYSVLIEIEESLGDQLLSALAENRIAAYVVPAKGPGGATRLILHVDALRRVPAGIVLAGLAPARAGELPADGEPAAESVSPSNAANTATAANAASPAPDSQADDAAFAELVAGFHRPTERTWPDAEDLPDEPDLDETQPPSAPASPPPITVLPYDPKTEGERRRPPGSRPGRPPVSMGKDAPLAKRIKPVTPSRPVEPPDDAEDSFDALADDQDDHYVPPPLPRLEPPPTPTRWALLGLAFGLALLLFPTLLTLDHTTALDVIGVLCVLASTAVLVSRLRDRSPDDPDDGAVV